MSCETTVYFNMARKCLIIGATGTGKTHSAKYLDPSSTVIICPDEKEPPFRGWRKNWTIIKESATIAEISAGLDNCRSIFYTASFTEIRNLLNGCSKRPQIKTVLIDTITHAQIKSFMDNAKVKGFDKFTDMAAEVYNLIKSIDKLRDDMNVVVLAHSDLVDHYGQIKTKFSVPGGKLIGEKIKVEGMFTIVLETDIEFEDNKPKYSFITQNTGTNMAKSPEGMFEEMKIENNLVTMLEAIEQYEN